jgi:hypothetical protein
MTTQTTCSKCGKQVAVSPVQSKVVFHPAADGNGHCTGSGMKVRREAI